MFKLFFSLAILLFASPMIASLKVLASTSQAPEFHPNLMREDGAIIRPPVGLISLCQRDPEFCGAQFPSDAIFVASAQPVSSTQSRRSVSGHRKSSFTLSDLMTINHALNAEILSMADADIHNQVEHWSLPIEWNGHLVGDCEDYALAKRKRLIALGWNPSDLHLAVVRTEVGTLHTVLIASLEGGDYVLDNLRNDVQPWQARTDLTWIARQGGTNLLHWYTL